LAVLRPAPSDVGVSTRGKCKEHKHISTLLTQPIPFPRRHDPRLLDRTAKDPSRGALIVERLKLRYLRIFPPTRVSAGKYQRRNQTHFIKQSARYQLKQPDPSFRARVTFKERIREFDDLRLFVAHNGWHSCAQFFGANVKIIGR
jgi:hypothetical protein